MPGGNMATAAPKKPNPVLLIAAGVVVLAVVLFAAVKIFAGGSGYMKPIKYLEKGFNKRDIKTIQKAFADSGEISPDMVTRMQTATMSLRLWIKRRLPKERLKMS